MHKNLCTNEEPSGWPSEIDHERLRAIIEADPFTTTQEFAQELNADHSIVVWHLKQIGKVKKFKWCLMNWSKIQNIIILEWRLLILCNNNKEPFLDRIVMCDKKGFYTTADNSSSMVGLIRSTKALLKAKLSPKKVIVTIWWLAVTLIHYSFLNPRKIITFEKYAQEIYEIHWKLWCLQEGLVNRKISILLHDNAWPHVTQVTLRKLNELGYKVLPHLPYLPDLSPTNYHFFKHPDKFFLWGKHFHNK